MKYRYLNHVLHHRTFLKPQFSHSNPWMFKPSLACEFMDRCREMVSRSVFVNRNPVSLNLGSFGNLGIVSDRARKVGASVCQGKEF